MPTSRRTQNGDKLRDNLQSLKNGSLHVPLSDLMDPEFMEENSSHSSIDEFLNQFNLPSADDFKSIPPKELDEHVKRETNFSSWEEMLKAAAARFFARKKLMEGINPI